VSVPSVGPTGAKLTVAVSIGAKDWQFGGKDDVALPGRARRTSNSCTLPSGSVSVTTGGAVGCRQ